MTCVSSTNNQRMSSSHCSSSFSPSSSSSSLSSSSCPQSSCPSSSSYRSCNNSHVFYNRKFTTTLLWSLIIGVLLFSSSVLCHEDIEVEVDNKDDDGVTVEVAEDDIVYTTPTVHPHHRHSTYFAEHFDDLVAFKKRWIKSEAKKEGLEDDIAKYDGVWDIEAAEADALKNDFGLVLKSKAKHAAISARLDKPFVFDEKPLVIQYEVNMQSGQECGGAYLKLLSQDRTTGDLRQFHDKTPYSIMFGPDKCGSDYKLHFIFRHKNPINGTISEKHCKKPKERLEEPFSDKKPHLYTLILRPDNTFHIYVDHKVVNEGSLLEDFSPPVNPPEEIDDPTDVRPADWDDRERIPDATATKPDDWDEDAPQYIPDPDATKPDGWLDDELQNIPDPSAEKPGDWEEEIDGDWEAPLISNPVCEEAPGCGTWTAPEILNPSYKGKWRPPMVDNPNYQGKWAPRRIPNPHYFEDREPFRMTPIVAVGLELWSMSNQIMFDNIIVTDDLTLADSWASQTFDVKRKKMEKVAVSYWGKLMKTLHYKPGWWTVYFIYCSIPVILYIYYLYWRLKKESLLTAIIKYTNEHPWLWAVYIVVIALPIVLILAFCCGSSKDKEDNQKQAHPKKTDEPCPDDPGAEDEDAAEDEGGYDSAKTSEAIGATSKTSKQKVDLEEETADQEGNKDEEEEEEDEEGGEEVEEEEETGTGVSGGGDAPPSPRKRRSRKD